MNKINTIIGVAALALAAVLTTAAQAQERTHAYVFINGGLPTAYAPGGGTNYVHDMGLVRNSGTNTVTLTSGQTVYNSSNAAPVWIGKLQETPVAWQVVVTSSGTSLSNTVVGLDLSPDGVYWSSNAVTLATGYSALATNMVSQYYPLINGTNAFTGYGYARWSYASTAQLTNVTLLANQLLSFH